MTADADWALQRLRYLLESMADFRRDETKIERSPEKEHLLDVVEASGYGQRPPNGSPARNLEAARMLDELAKDLPNVLPHELEAYAASLLEPEDEIGINMTEIEREVLWQIGFHSAPSGAADLVRDLTEQLVRDLAPNLIN